MRYRFAGMPFRPQPMKSGEERLCGLQDRAVQETENEIRLGCNARVLALLTEVL